MGMDNRKHVTSAQRLVNKVARWVTGCGKATRITSLMEEVGWLSIQELTLQHSLVQMWKILYFRKPEGIREKITIEEDLHITTRAPRLQFTKNSFISRTVQEWNTVPLEIRQIKNINSFKTNIKKWILMRREPEPDD